MHHYKPRFVYFFEDNLFVFNKFFFFGKLCLDFYSSAGYDVACMVVESVQLYMLEDSELKCYFSSRNQDKTEMPLSLEGKETSYKTNFQKTR